MPEDKDKKESEIKDEPIITEDGGVEVKVDEPAAQEKHEDKKPPVQQPDPEKSFRNKVYAQDRIISKMQRDHDELLEKYKTLEQKTIQPSISAEQDDIDRLAQTDWKGAVRELAKREAQQIVQKERTKIAEESSQIEVQQLLDKNAEFVVSKHGELNDPNSEKSQIYQDILNENPRWRTNPDGPLLVMYEMENELRKKGYKIDDTVENNDEARLTRARANSLPPSKPSNSNKFVLTKEQKEFCDEQNIPYNEYAKTVLKVGGGKGVEIQ
jgi:hypothetical protein